LINRCFRFFGTVEGFSSSETRFFANRVSGHQRSKPGFLPTGFLGTNGRNPVFYQPGFSPSETRFFANRVSGHAKTEILQAERPKKPGFLKKPGFWRAS
jgi:hypothetical protein